VKCLPRITANSSMDTTSVHSFALTYTWPNGAAPNHQPRSRRSRFGGGKREKGSKERRRRGTHGVLDGIGGDDGGVVAGGVGGEAVGDDADGDAPLDDDVAPRRGGAAPDAGDADAGLAVPALELELPGHGRRGDLICGCCGGACECGGDAMRSLVVYCPCALCRRGGTVEAVRYGGAFL
jgi:hypothetical protein